MLMDAIDGHTRLYGLFAHPAEHSLSPLMHNLSFHHRHLNALYLAFDIREKEDIGEAVNSFRLLNMGGANLSMPFKKTVLPYLDELTPMAQIIGAVNTIVNRQGRLIGANTDGTGFFANLRSRQYEVQQKTATILGAGGAGMSIITAGAAAGLKTIHVFKRRNTTFQIALSKLKRIADTFHTSIRLYAYDDRTSLQDAVSASDFLINTTNIGMGDDRQAVPMTLQHMPSSLTVCDVIYEPRRTRFLQMAEEQGCATVNGLGMLIHQGAQAFKLWTDQDMPIEDVKAAIKKKISNT